MLHTHIETLLDHWVLKIDVWSWSDIWFCSFLMMICRQSFLFESSLLGVKDCTSSCSCCHCCLGKVVAVVSWLLESTWSHLVYGSKSVFGLACVGDVASFALWVLARSWDIEFQALTVKDLVVVESWWCLIKTNVLSGEQFVVSSSSFLSPFSSCILEIILNFFICPSLAFGAFNQRIISKLTGIISLCFLLRIEYSNHWMSLFKGIKSVSCRHENAISLSSFFFWSCKCSCASLTFSFNTQIVFQFILFLNFDKFSNILSRIRSLFWL